MKKTTKIAIIALGTIILLIIIIAGITYKTTYSKTEVKTEVEALISNDNKYKLIIYEIGEPDWPFGSTHCRFVLYNDGEKVNELNFDIRNDGGRARRENFNVQWNADNVLIVVRGKEQKDISYYLYFDGSTDIKSTKK